MGSDQHFGFFIAECLTKGSSDYCTTYRNPMLDNNVDFIIADLEIWGFNKQ